MEKLLTLLGRKLPFYARVSLCEVWRSPEHYLQWRNYSRLYVLFERCLSENLDQSHSFLQRKSRLLPCAASYRYGTCIRSKDFDQSRTFLQRKSRPLPCAVSYQYGIRSENPVIRLARYAPLFYGSNCSLPLPKCDLREFHTSGRRPALPPLIWAAVSLMSKAGAVLSGRKYRQWLREQPEEVQNKHHRRVIQFWMGLTAFITTLACIYYYSHIQEAPLTRRRRFISLTKEQYMKVSEFESESFCEEYKDKLLPATHPAYEVVVRIARKIVNANKDFPGIKDYLWKIHVIDDPEKNAFVLPNGHIFVFTGMLKFVENEDQFAFILGHEMSHALLLHGAEQLSYNQFIDYLVIAVMAAIWTLMPSDGIAIVTNWFYNQVMDLTVHKPYNRVLEKEADRVGLYLVAKACYDVRESSVLWYHMSIADDLSGDRIPEWLSTHPAHENRVKMIDGLIPKAIEEREKCNCDFLPDIDPRRRAIAMRKMADNVMIAKASKANIDKTHKDSQSVPAFNPFRLPSLKPKTS